MGQPKEPRDWKFMLQQTGLPLEQSVKAVLRQHGVRYPRELQFERLDETGKPFISSVDILGHLFMKPFDARVLVECKYRRDDVQWLFAPATAEGYAAGSRRDVLNVFENLHKDVKLGDRGLHQKMSIPLVEKGVEMKGADTMDSTIRKAIFQLRFGAQQVFREYIESMADDWLRTVEDVPALVPIIVTTADLWRLRDDVGVEEVRNASEFTEVAVKANVLLIYDPPDPIVRREMEARLRSEISKSNQAEIDELCKGGYHPRDFTTLTEYLAGRPRFFYVMSFAHFNRSFNSLKDYFENFPFEKIEAPAPEGSG